MSDLGVIFQCQSYYATEQRAAPSLCIKQGSCPFVKIKFNDFSKMHFCGIRAQETHLVIAITCSVTAF